MLNYLVTFSRSGQFAGKLGPKKCGAQFATKSGPNLPRTSVLVGRGFPIRVKGLNWKIGGSFQIEHSAVGLLLLLKRSWVFAVDLRDIGGGGEDCDYGKQQKSNCVPVHNVCTHCALHSLLLGKVHMNSQQRREFFSFPSAITNCVMFPDPRVSWGT